jgi:uncharacterized protein
MQWELLSEPHQERNYLLIFETGDEVMERLTQFVAELGVTAARFSAIGAFSEVTLAYFDWNLKKYRDIPVNEQVEMLMFAGDVSILDDQPKIHAHAVVGCADGTTRGGHFVRGRVRPTLELVITESARFLSRSYDPVSGLDLMDLNALPGHPHKKTRSA